MSADIAKLARREHIARGPQMAASMLLVFWLSLAGMLALAGAICGLEQTVAELLRPRLEHEQAPAEEHVLAGSLR